MNIPNETLHKDLQSILQLATLKEDKNGGKYIKIDVDKLMVGLIIYIKTRDGRLFDHWMIKK